LDAQKNFKDQLRGFVDPSAGISLDQYVRYLTMQYHLTNGVQRHFLIACSHPSLASKRKLRDFLYQFALEEEPHFEIAFRDLVNLGKTPLDPPLDVKLWWSYFSSVVEHRPFLRLGATCILENISAGSGSLIDELIKSSAFLNPRNTRFLVIHKHEDLPHGNQILAVIDEANLSTEQHQDLAEGAMTGKTLFLRMMHWALTGETR
jgi:hypothetical protein